eukprot:gnl/TRDRNA2_/TRDRNA2_168708_c0_seq1.p1 gnl/TRDRNA2_/TRDRNA2_168708_c0~~gnl/TRDRNA2_/TRDRNA2_168708_c0_seq1.p1  ORF type:complete len:785 (-),score=146.63 gnl/TRDRNA2_/TRDRNA2_168708_c0_seq1:126-2480(-)
MAARRFTVAPFSQALLLLAVGVIFRQPSTGIASADADAPLLLEQGLEFANQAAQLGPAQEKEAAALNRQAAELARRATELQPSNSSIQLGLGEILYAAGEYEEAVGSLSIAHQLDPSGFDVNYLLGMSHGLGHNYFEAERHLRVAVELSPEDSEAQMALGSALGNTGRMRDAEKVLARALIIWRSENAVSTLEGTEAIPEDNDDGPGSALYKHWERMGRVAGPFNQFWRIAMDHEEMAAVEVTGLREPLGAVRAREASPEWERQRLGACLESPESHSCGLGLVTMQAWNAAWELAHKLAAKPQGGHVVLGGGLGSLCLFALHAAGATSCDGFVQLQCAVATEAKSLATGYAADGKKRPGFSCDSPGHDALAAADVVWVEDAEAPKEIQVENERRLVASLSPGAVAVLFRTPHLEPPGLRVVGSFDSDAECIVWHDWTCHNPKPVASWLAKQNLTGFVLGAPTASSADDESPPPQCAAGGDHAACGSGDFCTEAVSSSVVPGRPKVNISALPAGSAAHWCSSRPIMRVDGFVSAEELSSLKGFLDAKLLSSLNGTASGLRDLGTPPGDCTHVWTLGDQDEDPPDQTMAVLHARMSSIIGSQWGMLSVNEAKAQGVQGCNVGVRNIHHDRNFYPQRFATVILYLSDVEDGGHTIFPLLETVGNALDEDQRVLRSDIIELFLPQASRAFPPRQLILPFKHSLANVDANSSWTARTQARMEGLCARAADASLRGAEGELFAFRPRAGTAVVFWHDIGSDMAWDTFHTGCPVRQGTKWTFQKFAERFQP